MERVIATYDIEGHRVHVVEHVDEDAVSYQLVVDNCALPVDMGYAAPPTEPVVTETVREWEWAGGQRA